MKKNQSYHIATCLHQLVVLICKSQLHVHVQYLPTKTTCTFTTFTVISCTLLVSHCRKATSIGERIVFPLSLVPFNLYDNLSETTRQEESNLKRPVHSYPKLSIYKFQVTYNAYEAKSSTTAIIDEII